jgi:hypothetical protein
LRANTDDTHDSLTIGLENVARIKRRRTINPRNKFLLLLLWKKQEEFFEALSLFFNKELASIIKLVLTWFYLRRFCSLLLKLKIKKLIKNCLRGRDKNLLLYMSQESNMFLSLVFMFFLYRNASAWSRLQKQAIVLFSWSFQHFFSIIDYPN